MYTVIHKKYKHTHMFAVADQKATKCWTEEYYAGYIFRSCTKDRILSLFSKCRNKNQKSENLKSEGKKTQKTPAFCVLVDDYLMIFFFVYQEPSR